MQIFFLKQLGKAYHFSEWCHRYQKVPAPTSESHWGFWWKWGREMQSTCTVYIGSQILAVQHTDESNAHEVNKFPKTRNKQHFNGGEKFRLYIKSVYLMWLIFHSSDWNKKLLFVSHSVPPTKIKKYIDCYSSVVMDYFDQFKCSLSSTIFLVTVLSLVYYGT